MAKEKIAPTTLVFASGSECPKTLSSRQMIYDAEFNYSRSIAPVSDDGTEQDLRGAVTSDSPFGGVVNDVVIRVADEEERQRWWELHQNDNFIMEKAEEERQNWIPYYIVADGFGRVDAVVADEEKGPDFQIKISLLASSDRLDGIDATLLLSNSSRQHHHLDKARSFQMLKKDRGWTQSQIAARYGMSPALVSQIMKSLKLKPEDWAKAIKGAWSLNRCIKVVDGYDTSGQKAGGPTRADSSPRIPAKKVDRYIDNALAVALDTLEDGSEEHSALYAIQFAMEFLQGRYKNKGLLKAAQGVGLLSSVDFDFEAALNPVTQPVDGSE